MYKIFDHGIGAERDATPKEAELFFVVPSQEELSAWYRQERDSLISQCDWTQLPDVTMTTEKAEQWKVYRQQLRDITLQKDFPNKIEWPVIPK
jgi:hypothetical protein